MPDSQTSYFHQSRTPLNNLVFYLPWLIVYEIGLWLSRDPYRNLADIWLRELLQWAGFSQHLLLPLLSCAVLLGWHHISKLKWRVDWHCLPGMLIECVGYAIVLFGVFQIQHLALKAIYQIANDPVAAWIAEEVSSTNVHHLLSMIGAGIYEELFFRLLLLPVVIWVLLRIELKTWLAYGLAVTVVSLGFAAAHSIGIEQDWFTFVFRFFVGAILSVVFLKRGFGVAVGAHALYNIAVAVLY